MSDFLNDLTKDIITNTVAFSVLSLGVLAIIIYEFRRGAIDD